VTGGAGIVLHTEDAVLNAITITDDGRGWIVGNDGLLLALERASKQANSYPNAAFHADADAGAPVRLTTPTE